MDKAKLDQYMKGEASLSEKKEIVQWLEESSENMREFMALRKLYDINLWHDHSISQSGHKLQPRLFRNNAWKIAKETLKVAAIIIVTFLAIKYYPDSDTEGFQTYYTPEGQRAEVQLSDGTRVWLNANSRLIYPTRFNTKDRKVTLEGEAFFSVTRNEQKPFIVQAKGYNIEVLGTEFNVSAYNQSDFFETALLKGEVKVVTPSDELVFLKPNMRIYAQAGKTHRGMIENPDRFLWKEGIISFNHETVKEIFSKLELYYDVKIEVKNPRLLNYRFTGKFRTLDGVEHVLKVLQLKHQFTYQRINDTKVIIIK